jgi:NAD(P)-dependent dehydrogenase (short-subunit alcohol dehydrogenase family)
MSNQYIVVGGSKGIGKGITHNLLEEGHNVLVISRTNTTGFENSFPNQFSFISKDLSTEDIDKSQLPEKIDGLVYCPGSITLKPIRSLSVEQFQEDFNINVLGAVKAVKACLTGFKKSESLPSIVLFSTVAVQQGMPFHSSIASAKGAVEGLVRSLAAEMAPNVRVNCVAPSLTDTDLAANILSSPERKEASNQRHPLKRYGSVNDIADAAIYLLSDKSSWVTGQVLNVDGGLSRLR